LSASPKGKNRVGGDHHAIEKVHLDSGLYFGDRNTEPRAALVAHFIIKPKGKGEQIPLDIFVVNLHLTTLTMEREGIPEIDLSASKIRQSQLDIIFRGIVSRYNTWKTQGFPVRGERRKAKKWESFKRHQPLWILAGDFNFTEESVEYNSIKNLNFIDVINQKGSGTKSKGVGSNPTLTVDYIFAGPEFISLDPIITKEKIKSNVVIHRQDVKKISDHFPMFASIPLPIQRLIH
jgi:endonuclease/exonuclease/phosphatase family metal-dependent hydrolase